jgi:cell division protein FtsB
MSCFFIRWVHMTNKPLFFVGVAQPRWDDAAKPGYLGTFCTPSEKRRLAHEVATNQRDLRIPINHAGFAPFEIKHVSKKEEVGAVKGALVDDVDNFWVISELHADRPETAQIRRDIIAYNERRRRGEAPLPGTAWGLSMYTILHEDKKNKSKFLAIDPIHVGITQTPDLAEHGTWIVFAADDEAVFRAILAKEFFSKPGYYVPEATRQRWAIKPKSKPGRPETVMTAVGAAKPPQSTSLSFQQLLARIRDPSPYVAFSRRVIMAEQQQQQQAESAPPAVVVGADKQPQQQVEPAAAAVTADGDKIAADLTLVWQKIKELPNPTIALGYARDLNRDFLSHLKNLSPNEASKLMRRFKEVHAINDFIEQGEAKVDRYTSELKKNNLISSESAEILRDPKRHLPPELREDRLINQFVHSIQEGIGAGASRLDGTQLQMENLYKVKMDQEKELEQLKKTIGETEAQLKSTRDELVTFKRARDLSTTPAPAPATARPSGTTATAVGASRTPRAPDMYDMLGAQSRAMAQNPDFVTQASPMFDQLPGADQGGAWGSRLDQSLGHYRQFFDRATGKSSSM